MCPRYISNSCKYSVSPNITPKLEFKALFYWFTFYILVHAESFFKFDHALIIIGLTLLWVLAVSLSKKLILHSISFILDLVITFPNPRLPMFDWRELIDVHYAIYCSTFSLRLSILLHLQIADFFQNRVSNKGRVSRW